MGKDVVGLFASTRTPIEVCEVVEAARAERRSKFEDAGIQKLSTNEIGQCPEVGEIFISRREWAHPSWARASESLTPSQFTAME